MKRLEYTVTFHTPAFLGNAAQSGQWRTPPFKALLRQWWRVVYAADRKFNVNIDSMRREEGLLFGNAWCHIAKGIETSQITRRVWCGYGWTLHLTAKARYGPKAASKA